MLRSSRHKDLLVFQQLPAAARGAIVASVSGGSLGFAPFQTRPMPLSEAYTSKARPAPKTHGVLLLRLGQPLQDSQIEGRACWSRVEFARMNGGLGNSGRPVGFGIEPSAEISIPPSDTIPVGATKPSRLQHPESHANPKFARLEDGELGLLHPRKRIRSLSFNGWSRTSGKKQHLAASRLQIYGALPM